jgi:hypothetical protein
VNENWGTKERLFQKEKKRKSIGSRERDNRTAEKIWGMLRKVENKHSTNSGSQSGGGGAQAATTR